MSLDTAELYQRAQELICAQEWSTWQEGSIREQALPHRVTGDCDGHPSEVRFGAFVGWQESSQWWLDVGAQLPPKSIESLNLLDIDHQAGGHFCTTWLAICLPVAINPTSLGFVADMCRDYYYARKGHFRDCGPEALAEYRARLAEFDLTAETVFEDRPREPMEAVYPMDGTDANLDRVLADPNGTVHSLEPLISLPEARARLRLFVLADNSD